MGATQKRFSATRRIQRYADRLIRINTALNLNFLRHGEQEPPIDLARGSIKAFPPIYFSDQKKLRHKFHVTHTFCSREIKLCFTSPPLMEVIMAMHPPPPLEHFIPPLHVGINKSADVAACRLPLGVPLRQPIF